MESPDESPESGGRPPMREKREFVLALVGLIGAIALSALLILRGHSEEAAAIGIAIVGIVGGFLSQTRRKK